MKLKSFDFLLENVLHSNEYIVLQNFSAIFISK